MTRKARGKIDPIEQEIELALNPGAFIPDRACFSFVSDLDGVAAKIAKLIASDPSRAVTLPRSGVQPEVERLLRENLALKAQVRALVLELKSERGARPKVSLKCDGEGSCVAPSPTGC